MRKLLAILVLSTPLLCWTQTYYDIKWDDQVGVNVDYLAQTMVKTASTGWTNCGAFSNNVLPPNDDGHVRCYIPTAGESKIVGLSYNNGGEGLTGVDFAYQYDNARLYIIESGTVIGSYGRPRSGDELKVSREGTNIKYYLNGAVLRTTTCSNTQKMFIDASLFHNGATLNDVEATFDHYVFAIPTTTNVDEATDGSAKLDLYGGTPPYKFYWGEDYMSEGQYDIFIASLDSSLQPTGVNYEDIFQTSDDSISVYHSGWVYYTIIDSTGYFISDSTVVSHDLEANNLSQATTSGMQITRTGASGTFEAAFHNGIVTGEHAYVEFTGSTVAFDFAAGLRIVGQPSFNDGSHIKYGLSIESGDLYFRNNGVSTQIATGVVESDRFAYQFHEDQFIAYLNGSELHSETITTGIELTEDFFLTKGGSYIDILAHDLPWITKFKNARIEIEHIGCGEQGTGEIDVYFPGDCSNNYVLDLIEPDLPLSWAGSGSTASFTDLVAGVYELTLTSTCGTYVYDIEIGHNIEWETFGDATLISISDPVSGPALNNSTQNAYAGGISTNMLKPGFEGWIEFDIRLGNENLTGQAIRFAFSDVAGLGKANFYTWQQGGWYFCYVDDTPIGAGAGPETIQGFSQLRLRIERDANGYEYSLFPNFEDDQLPDYTFALNQAEMIPLKVSGSLGPGSMIVRARASFPCDVPVVQYANLKKKLDGSRYIAVDGHIYFTYDNEYHNIDTDQSLILKVYDESHIDADIQGGLINGHPLKMAAYGHNTYDLDLAEVGITTSGTYVLEITNDKGEQYYLKFVY